MPQIKNPTSAVRKKSSRKMSIEDFDSAQDINDNVDELSKDLKELEA